MTSIKSNFAVLTLKRASNIINDDCEEARVKANFLAVLREIVEQLPIVFNSVAFDLLQCCEIADLSDDRIDSFFTHSLSCRLGKALQEHEGFRAIEIVDGLESTSSATFLCVLNTMETTPERKLALRDALLVSNYEKSQSVDRLFFDMLATEPIVKLLEERADLE